MSFSPGRTAHGIPSAASYGVALVFFASVFVLFGELAVQATQAVVLTGDAACIESGVVNAARGSQHVGTYSRLGWNNPGPIYFYSLLPFYLLYSMEAQSLYLGALFLNIVSVLIVLSCLLRRVDDRLFLLAAFLLALYVQHYLGLRLARSIWDPHVTILPFAAFTLLCARLSAGSLRALPVTAVVFTFLVQTRVGFTPVALWMFSLALLLCTRQHGGLRALVASRELRVAGGISVATVSILWALPLADVVREPPGNLGEVAWYFWSSTDPGQTLHSALLLVAKVSNDPFVAAVAGVAPRLGVVLWMHPLATFFGQIALAVAALVVCRVRANRTGLMLLTLSLSSLPICVGSVMRVPGDVHLYLLKWISVLGLIQWGAIACVLLMAVATGVARLAARGGFAPGAGIQRLATPVAALVVAIALLIDLREGLGEIERFEGGEARPFVREVSRAVETYARREKLTAFLVQPNSAQNQIQAGILNQLNKASVAFYVDDAWALCVGDRFRNPGDAEHTLVFAAAPPRRHHPRSTPVYESPEHSTYVYHQRHDWPSNPRP